MMAPFGNAGPWAPALVGSAAAIAPNPRISSACRRLIWFKLKLDIVWSSKHRVVVFRRLWNFLNDIPVLNNFAVFNPENIDHGLAARAGDRDVVTVNHNQITLGDNPLEVHAYLRVRACQPLHKTNERLRAVR